MSRPKKELTYIDKAFHYPVISRYTSHIFSYHFHNTISGTQIHHQLWIRNNIHIFFTLADIEAFVYSGMYPPLKLLRLHTIKKPKPLSLIINTGLFSSIFVDIDINGFLLACLYFMALDIKLCKILSNCTGL